MPTAKKLPSGSWRCLAYSHTEKIFDEKSGIWKNKRIYESFTSDDPTKRGKHEAELAANQFLLTKRKDKQSTINITLSEAIERYIEKSDSALSGTTMQGYRKDQYDSYKPLFDTRLRDITSDDLQDAVNRDCKRLSKRNKKNPKPISPKTVKNTYGFISAAIHSCMPDASYCVKLPTVPQKVKELIPPQTILEIIKGTDIELPCLLAMWLSFSMSEIRGIKYKDIEDGYLRIDRVVVDINGEASVKESGKAAKRLRKHRIPPYIMELIPKGDPDDYLIAQSGHAIYMKWSMLLKKNHLPHMTFHDLRHENASIMHMLNIPDKYAMERGGWKTDKVMKQIYTHTFSDGRIKADDTIDRYFENLLKNDPVDIDQKKYKAWLLLYEKEDSEQSKKEFLAFMQHEMQHEKKKAR